MRSNELKELIRSYIKELASLKESEHSICTGYNTPKAFIKNTKSVNDLTDELSTVVGYNQVKPSNRWTVKLNENRYHNFKNHPAGTRKKLNICLREIKKCFKNIDFLIKIATKLKDDTGVSSDIYWKNVKENDIPEIFEHIATIYKKMERLTK